MGSHFNEYHDKLPLRDGVSDLKFNYQVTDTSLEECFKLEDSARHIAAIANSIVEQTYFEIFSPSCPDKPLKNLSASKHFGVFFTTPKISKVMFSKFIRSGRELLLDPCVGSGALLQEAILGERKNYRMLVGIDSDPWLAHWSKIILDHLANRCNFNATIEIIQGDGLNYLLSEEARLRSSSMDLILNPPYGRMRFTKDRITNFETALSDTLVSEDIRILSDSIVEEARRLKSHPLFAKEKGILERSRLFFLASADLASAGAKVSIITPDTWMAGRDTSSLRAYLVAKKLISEVVLIKETLGDFSTVNQSTSITFLDNRKRHSFQVKKFGQQSKYELNYNNFTKEKAGLISAVPKLPSELAGTFEKLKAMRKFGDIEEVINRRGEVDQSTCKYMFSAEATGVRLVRGDHIKRYQFDHEPLERKASYVTEDLYIEHVSGKPKGEHFEKHRLAGRQCSYLEQERRLHFAVVPPHCAIGNSCNYLVLTGKLEGKMNLFTGLLNSAVLDWYFRIQNSNNHVANYEIDTFPFPTEEKWFSVIETLVQYITEIDRKDTIPLRYEEFLESVVALSFGLDPEVEFRKILEELNCRNIEQYVNTAQQLRNRPDQQLPMLIQGYFNNEYNSLSELDKLVISHVPEGGNWQDIPETVPGQRLVQIREMTAERGVVRTTYYGRLRRDQPSYTMNTYFNRPGNGTHIHPIEDRTLTSREAARLQSFPDSYIFMGSQSAVRNQIGNAVPPLLAYAVGEKFIEHADTRLCVDMFCGAGGLSLGLEKAGWKTLAAVDCDKNAVSSFLFNRPSILEPEEIVDNVAAVYQRDLQDLESFKDLVKKLKQGLRGRTLDLMVGGPPCQGFSHAGFRLENDARNDLASVYLNLADQLKPRIFILENVEGLQTIKKGQVLEDIIMTLSGLGYRVHEPVWKLHAEQFGVPQMRRRVFVVASLDSSVDLTPPEPEYQICPGRRKKVAESDLFESTLRKPVTVAQALAGLSLPEADENDFANWVTTPHSY